FGIRGAATDRPLAPGHFHEGFRRAGLLRQPAFEVHRPGRPPGVALLFGEFRAQLEPDTHQGRPAGKPLRTGAAADPAAGPQASQDDGLGFTSSCRGTAACRKSPESTLNCEILANM